MFVIPNSISPFAQNMIAGILNIHPDARFTIEQIKMHPWYNLVKPNEQKGVIPGDK